MAQVTQCNVKVGRAITIIVFWVVASKVMQTAKKVSAESAVSVFRTE